MSGDSKAASLRVVGPEGVPLAFPPALIAERVFAFSIDMLIIAAIFTAIVLVSVYMMGFMGMMEPIILVMVGLFALRYFYFTAFEVYWQGSTPGKRLMNLKVISRDGTGLTTEAVVARNLMRDVELFLPLVALTNPDALFGNAPGWLQFAMVMWLALMLFLPFFGKERTRVGDLVGGTLVVRVPRVRLLADEAARPQTGLSFTAEQLTVYGEKELETLAELIRDFDSGKAKAGDITVVAAAIARKIRFGGDAPRTHSIQFLRSFYKAQRDALERKLLFGKRKASKDDS